MYYHEHSEIIDTSSSYLNPKQVFTGNYWDEFGWTPYLVPDNAQVLMLGLASGGGLRPLLSSSKKIHLKCVDLDKKSIEKCRNLFQKNFPELSFESIQAEAKSFLAKSPELYDLIWLDIYNQDSYSALYFEEGFLKSLKRHLKPNGVLLTNAYGLPVQFNPLEKNTVQRECARHLQKNFAFVSALPGRRNQTLVASNGRPIFFNAKPHPALSALDKRSFLVQGMRLHYLKELPVLSEVSINLSEASKFSTIDQDMRTCWKDLLFRLSAHGIALNNPIDLLGLIQNQDRCESFMDRAILKKNLSSLDFIPVLCAGESFVHAIDVEWIFSWVLRNHQFLKLLDHQKYVQLWLTQLWALVLHPSRRYRAYCFQILALFEEAL